MSKPDPIHLTFEPSDEEARQFLFDLFRNTKAPEGTSIKFHHTGERDFGNIVLQRVLAEQRWLAEQQSLAASGELDENDLIRVDA